MVLTEYNEKEVMEDLKNEAYNNGYEQGTKTLNTLYALLIKSNRLDDLSRATVDPQFQVQLIKELLPEFSKENIACPKV